MTEKRFWLYELMNELRRPGALGSSMEVRCGSRANEKGFGENARGKVPDWRYASAISAADWACARRAGWGSTTLASRLSRENPLTCVGERLKIE